MSGFGFTRFIGFRVDMQVMRVLRIYGDPLRNTTLSRQTLRDQGSKLKLLKPETL